MKFEQATFTETIRSYGTDQTCAPDKLEQTKTRTGKWTVYPQYPGTFAKPTILEITMQKITFQYTTVGIVSANRLATCGKSDWTAGTEVDVSALTGIFCDESAYLTKPFKTSIGMENESIKLGGETLVGLRFKADAIGTMAIYSKSPQYSKVAP